MLRSGDSGTAVMRLPGRPYNYDFLAGLFIFCCNLHNMEQRYTESL